MRLNPHRGPRRCCADERNHCRKPVQTLQLLMASFLLRVLSAASLFEFAAQDASLFAVVRPFLHLGFDARVRQIANALLKFPSHVISHRCSPSRAPAAAQDQRRTRATQPRNGTLITLRLLCGRQKRQDCFACSTGKSSLTISRNAVGVGAGLIRRFQRAHDLDR
jgi:hypothetical protein